MPETLQIQKTTTPNARTFYGHKFPPVFLCESGHASVEDARGWVKDHREQILEQLAESGAVLFRGFGLESAQDFDAFIRAFEFEPFTYDESLSNAVRINKTDLVFTANESPPSFNILLHHEMAQTPIYPSKLFFFCEKAAEKGGQTPLCRSDVLFELLQEHVPAFAAKCESDGLKYTTVMPPENDPESGMGRSWKSTFSVETKEQAEQKMRDLGYTWQWEEGDVLRATTPVLKAVRELPETGRQAFFNQLIAAWGGWKDKRNDPSKAIRHGDDSPLDPDAMSKAIELSEEATVDLPWRAGDVALVDNYVVMHGRRPFEGKRSVMASLVRGNTYDDAKAGRI